MRIYYLMFIYIFVLGIFFKGVYVNQGNKDKNYTPFAASLFMVLPVFFIGLRTGFADTQAYISGFQDLTTNFKEIVGLMENSRGVLFVLYEWIIKKYISDNANVLLMITAIIQAAGIVKFYRKYSIDYAFSILLFFLSCMFFYMSNGMRQFLAVCIILYFADYIFERQYLKFVIVVLIASLIHVSALIWLPAVFIVQGKPFNFRVILMAIVIALAVFYVDAFTNILEDSLIGTTYQGLTDQFATDDGSNVIHTLIAAVPVFLALLGINVVDQENDSQLNTFINISVFGMAISFLANFTSGILVGRMPVYFTIFNYVSLPLLINTVFEKKSARLVIMCCYAGYIAYMMYYFYAQNVYYVSSILGIDTRLH